MKQILQDLSNGNTYISTAPAPKLSSNSVLINTSKSLISTGTEKMLVDFGKASYIEKARQQPEKVKLVLDKIKTDGLVATLDSVRSKLSKPIPLGYCNVGVISVVDDNDTEFKVGDRVVSNGPHADLVKVSKNLCALVPDEVDDECAAFTVVASIGLQGVRLAQPTLGEHFVVTGVGLIGLLTVQLLRAHGCKVLAIDLDDSKLQLAKHWGAEICNPARGEDPIAAGLSFSRGYGVDGVIITASTKSNDPVTQAAQMCRKRGRIVLVGVTGLELNRNDFYEKELSFQVSCSYGPGRYEAEYEIKGQDYPIGFVRWTLKRNFEAVLDMMAGGQLDVTPLITHRYDFESAPDAYQLLGSDRSALGVILQYNSDFEGRAVKEVLLDPCRNFNKTKPILSIIGAGNYASRVLIPSFRKAGAQLHTLVTAGGVNSVIFGSKNGFLNASSDTELMLQNQEINTVVVATQHDTHASLVVDAINAGKNVFVEKPLAINLEELSQIEAAYHTASIAGKNTHLMVGFNRRFSPHAQKMKLLLDPIKEPKVFILTINAGEIPADHWIQDTSIGGGRIIGEACHFIDLLRFFIGNPITGIQVRRIGNNNYLSVKEDKAVITLGFADGSFGTIHYLANGSNRFPKERIEVFAAGKILQLDNFRKLAGFGWPNFKKMNLWKQDKGQNICCQSYINAIEQGTHSPIPPNEIFEVAKVTIDVALQLRAQKD